ncbi:(Fe-S)-binding protein, partial [Lysobacter antibioticus]|uniref:(Fe-S)-binding protein n=1 Tax=Lysobacter antibioticus TaxID=84531 RepID=UPI001140857E
RPAVFVGCVAGAYERPLRTALARLAAAVGIALDAPAGQGCCGALHAHAGDPAGAEALADANRRAFSGHRTVLTLASGCHESLARSLGGARDAIDFLAEHGERLRFRPAAQRVALHLPCSQRNLSRSAPALRRLLARVPHLQVVELDAGYGCCGASGSQMLTDPARAADFRAPLLEQFARSGATVLLSANIGCRLHLAGGTGLPVLHPLEFLAQCLDAEQAA